MNFYDTLNAFAQKANKSANESKFMYDSLYTSLVKADHLVFKHEVYKTLLEENASEVGKFGDHHSCRFGQWYEGEGKEHFGKTKAFKMIEPIHEQVHTQAIKALQCAIRHDCLEPESQARITEKMRIAEESSFELFDLLRAMVKEGNPDVTL
ncbi:CZB domain-containing protein [Sulfurimonas sp.]